MATDTRKFADQLRDRLNARTRVVKKDADKLSEMRNRIAPVTDFLSHLETSLKEVDPTIRIRVAQPLTATGEEKFSFRYEIDRNKMPEMTLEILIQGSKIHIDDRVFVVEHQQNEIEEYLGTQIVNFIAA